MSASFTDKARLAQEGAFQQRLHFAAATAGVLDPAGFVSKYALWCADSPIADAYAAACADPYQIREAENPTVITDKNISDRIVSFKTVFPDEWATLTGTAKVSE